MSGGFVGLVTADLHLPTASSLKDKRKPLHGLKAALVRATGGAVAEVGDHDLLRRSRVTIAVVSATAADVDRLLAAAERVLHGREFEVLGVARHLASVDELVPEGGLV